MGRGVVMAYSEKELNDLKKTAEKLGLTEVELGYGKCLKEGEVSDTELPIEDSSEFDDLFND